MRLTGRSLSGRSEGEAGGLTDRLRAAVPKEALRAVLLSWLAARFVVIGALAISTYFSHDGNVTSGGTPMRHIGLLGWDSAFYRDIAAHGYGALPDEARRFFPLLPLLVRAVGLGRGAGPVLLVLINLLAIAYPIALLILIKVEKWDLDLGIRSVWLLALAPPAFVLVMGYTEALAGLLSVGMFIALRTGRWKAAAVLGVLAGLCRPPGVLLAVPALIEALRAPRSRPLARAAAVLGPAVGAGLYFAYMGIRFGNPLQPLQIQQANRLHGPLTNPISTLVQTGHALARGEVQAGLHLPWIALLVVLLVLMARRLPLSYTAWSACALLTALLGTNLNSVERYAWSAFPFVLAAAWLLKDRLQLWQGVLAVTGALMASYSLLAFLDLYVP
jgi:Gpi18-like mannosyltransferase